MGVWRVGVCNCVLLTRKCVGFRLFVCVNVQVTSCKWTFLFHGGDCYHFDLFSRWWAISAIQSCVFSFSPFIQLNDSFLISINIQRYWRGRHPIHCVLLLSGMAGSQWARRWWVGWCERLYLRSLPNGASGCTCRTLHGLITEVTSHVGVGHLQYTRCIESLVGWLVGWLSAVNVTLISSNSKSFKDWMINEAAGGSLNKISMFSWNIYTGIKRKSPWASRAALACMCTRSKLSSSRCSFSESHLLTVLILLLQKIV